MDPLRHFGFLFRDISRLYTLNFQRHASVLNLTLLQCKVLSYLQRNEGISQAKLAYLTDTDPMTLMRILDRMEGDGLIERREDASDRRTRKLYLQAAALPVLDEIWRISDCARAESLSGLSDDERALLFGLMKRVYVNLETLLPDAPETTRPAACRPQEANTAAGQMQAADVQQLSGSRAP
jgi:MarR family transcriptional regulator for hemolysin